MHSVIRQYSGDNASALFDALEAKAAEVKRIIREVPGFVSYTLIRTPGGGVAVTVCKDKAGTDESTKRAAQWVKEHMNVSVAPPKVSEGGVILHAG